MTEPQFLADQLRRAFEGEAWHGPSVREVLEGVTASQAAARPAGGGHSIWELVLHIRNWVIAPVNTLRDGTPMPEVDPPELAFDWPEIGGTTETDWARERESMFAAARELCALLEKTPELRLQQIVPGREHSFRFLLHGVVQHTLYHGGQIAILKKQG